MRRMSGHIAALLFLAATLLCQGCDRSASGSPAPLVAVSNSYIESAVRDLLGADVAILRLAEPGMCPGHFDVRPSQVEALRHCRVLLRFDFQDALDAKFAHLVQAGLRIVAVRVDGGMCEPASYRSVCTQIADALVQAGLLERSAADGRLAAIDASLAELSAWALQHVVAAELDGRRAVSSAHQEAFCRFLGLDVRASYRAADTTSIAEIDRAVASGAQADFIIANLPEGRRLADALAGRLGATVVVFDNFPDTVHHGGRFEGLFRENVRRLIDATKQ